MKNESSKKTKMNKTQSFRELFNLKNELFCNFIILRKKKFKYDKRQIRFSNTDINLI